MLTMRGMNDRSWLTIARFACAGLAVVATGDGRRLADRPAAGTSAVQAGADLARLPAGLLRLFADPRPIVGWYPYPFLDPDLSGGYGGVALSCIAIAIGAAIGVWLVVMLGQRVRLTAIPDKVAA